MKKLYFLLLSVLIVIMALGLSACDVISGIIGGDPCADGHAYSEEWMSDGSKHWRESTCEHKAVKDEAAHSYVGGVCICGAKEPHTHTFASTWSKDGTKHWRESTCEHSTERADEANHSYVGGFCICGAEAPHTHTFASTWTKDDTKHWNASTCGHNIRINEADHSYVGGVCICGAAEPAHVHTFASTWSKDANKHWYAATCEHTDFRKSEATHDWGNDLVCDTCGYIHDHTYSPTFTYNDDKHWHASLCGHDTKLGETDHIYVNGDCVCGAHTHVFDSVWAGDESGHWYPSACGHNIKKDSAGHEYGPDYVCTVCGYYHAHEYSPEWSYNETHHWHAADCGHNAKDEESEHRFTDGEDCICGAPAPHTHSFSATWSADESGHWREADCGCELKTDEGEHDYGTDYVCDACGFTHAHSFSDAWSYNDTHHWNAATCGHDVRGNESEHFIGGDDACVANCGYKYEAPHEHSYSTKWSYDDSYHWNASTCEHSGLRGNEAIHEYGSDDVCDVCGYMAPIVITSADIAQDGWAYGSVKTNAKRIRVNRLIPIKAGTVIRYDMNGFELYIDLADGEGATTGDRIGWLTGSGEYLVQRDAYLGLTIAASGRNAAITPSLFNSDITIIPGTGEIQMTYEKVNVYKFGGEGNDWCFVYLPEGYDPDRAEPYPFVIANHGNGWNMDGSAKKANWTDNTMYMSAAEIAKQQASRQGRFIATDDKSLWYSNPTIEALLAAGYIVCGAQNYGDNLYGNDNCTNAVVDFFDHMVATYNVEDSCHMIGASNGAMTTLNAAEKLGSKVSSVIIQYPLASIITHYLAGGHRDNIEAAYGLDTSKTYTKAELEAALADYDVLYKNVVNGIKQGYYPAVKVYYSMTDTLTTAEANALPVIELLERSGKEVVGVQVDADGSNRQHGDAAHFDPEGYVEWFNAH